MYVITKRFFISFQAAVNVKCYKVKDGVFVSAVGIREPFSQNVLK
jgi:hypothetical protein